MPIIQSRPKACDIINSVFNCRLQISICLPAVPIMRSPLRVKFFIGPAVLHISFGYLNFKCRLWHFINLNSKGGMIMNFSKAGRCCLETIGSIPKKKYCSLL